MKKFRFDKAYYDRFYGNRETRVTTQRSIHRLGNFVCHYLKHLAQPVRNTLDLGCGLGYWQAVVKRHFPRSDYQGVEVSPYLCREFGWQRGSVVDYDAPEAFDFVICQGVLQYLPAAEARRAIENLGLLSRGALYLEVLTRRDWELNCDRSVTDGDVYLREGAWYRRELGRYFVHAGGGVWLSLRSPVVYFEMEIAE
ncbi:Methyltransferase domain protein [Planctomycetes bacterium Pan216]|uniref:Methyltransferase domain protein n=1 Tax=Kolteria novifilia TaxID=2527975 RepID=A0A518BBT4_9BACT|nr:Methyltransferase domain protein [Planctomycetes bacterium Pan216]